MSGSPTSSRYGWPGATRSDDARRPADGDGATRAALAARARPARTSRQALCGAKSCAAGARVTVYLRRGRTKRPPGKNTQARAVPADAGGEVGRTNAVARLPREELFDDPVLERMERDHDDPAAGTDDAHGGGERTLEVRELVVDRDAKSLEDTRRGIDAARPPRLDAGYETAKVVGRLERRLDTATDDRSRDARRLRLLAVLGEDASKVLLSPAVHDVGCPDASVRVRTHVQRAARAKAEAPLFVGELNRGESEIQEDAVDRNEAVRAGQVVEKREVRSGEDGGVTEARELARGDTERGGIAIEPEEPAARRGCIEDGGGVPAGTDRPVQIATAIARSKLGEYFGHENRLMSPLDPIAKFRSPQDRSRRRSGLRRSPRASARAPRPRGDRSSR